MSDLMFRIGDRLTNYANVDLTVERVAGGGFGLVVFGPNRLDNGEWCALKTMRPELLHANPRARDLFIREGLTWCGFWPHANLLTAVSVIEINHLPFLQLNYAERGNLREALRLGQPLSQRLLWAQMIAAGLDRLHTPDPEFLRPDPLVHRDLKPENILVDAVGYAKITDFGLAKVVEGVATALALPQAGAGEAANETPAVHDPTRALGYRTQRGQAVGTPAYMAPEQWVDAAAVGTPADMYAFGLILSELLAGRHALLNLESGYSMMVWRDAHRQEIPRPVREQVPELPEGVEKLYQALLAKNPAERPTAQEALRELQAAARVLGQVPELPEGVEKLYQALLAKNPAEQIELREVWEEVQAGVQALRQVPYVAPEVYPHTPEHERIMWHDLALAYYGFGQYREALDLNDRALALAPRNFDVLLGRGSIFIKLGRLDEALGVFEAAQAVLPPEDHLHRKMVWKNRGALLFYMRRHAEAEAAYAEAVALMPEAADTWANRSDNEWAWGRAEAQVRHLAEARTHLQRAIRHAEQAVRLNPDNPGYAALLVTMERELVSLR